MTQRPENQGDGVLAFETSSALGSVALGRGSTILGVRRFTRQRAHAIEFAPAIESLCREHHVSPEQIGLVIVSAGPGSFTGLRIGITAARSLAFALHANVVAIPTLEVIAQNALLADPRPRKVVVVLDAKRGHVYTSRFELRSDRYAPMDEPLEADPTKYLEYSGSDFAVLGEGVCYHREAILRSGLRVLPEELFAPKVETVFQLGIARAAEGATHAPRNLTPVYIRPPEAEEVWAARHGHS